MIKTKRARTAAQIIKQARQCLTVEERLTALENMVLLLMTKHNRVARDWQKDSKQFWQCIRAIADLEPDDDPPAPPRRRPRNVVDFAAYRKRRR